MRYRKFGNTDLLVSEIGFGAWAIGGAAMIGNTPIGWGESSDEDSVKAIEAALDAGINFFDTADIYGLGHSETLFGNVTGKRKDILIATKVGNVARDGKFTVDYSLEHILSACDASLSRLKRDRIDYYQLHTARMENLKSRKCIEAMELLKTKGKIRYWGISLNTFDPYAEAEFLMLQKLGNGFQLVLNIINQKALKLCIEAGRKGYGIIARMPLQFGLLTGKFDDGHHFPEDDHRKNRLTGDVIEAARITLKPVWSLCEKYRCTKTQLALSYILSYPEVSTVIPGIRTTTHVSSNTEGLFTLDLEDRAFIEQLGGNEFLTLMDLIRSKG